MKYRRPDSERSYVSLEHQTLLVIQLPYFEIYSHGCLEVSMVEASSRSTLRTMGLIFGMVSCKTQLTLRSLSHQRSPSHDDFQMTAGCFLYLEQVVCFGTYF